MRYWSSVLENCAPERDNTIHSWRGGEHVGMLVLIKLAQGTKGIHVQLSAQHVDQTIAVFSCATRLDRIIAHVRQPAHFPVLWILSSTGEHIGIISPHQFGPWSKGHLRSALCSTCLQFCSVLLEVSRLRTSCEATSRVQTLALPFFRLSWSLKVSQ